MFSGSVVYTCLHRISLHFVQVVLVRLLLSPWAELWSYRVYLLLFPWSEVGIIFLISSLQVDLYMILRRVRTLGFDLPRLTTRQSRGSGDISGTRVA